MIRSLQNLFAAATSHKPAALASPRTVLSNKDGVQADFQNLFRSVAKTTPAPVTPAPPAAAPGVPAPKTAADGPPRLGPMTADPNTHTSLFQTVFAEGYSTLQALLAERTIMLVAE